MHLKGITMTIKEIAYRMGLGKISPSCYEDIKCYSLIRMDSQAIKEAVENFELLHIKAEGHEYAVIESEYQIKEFNKQVIRLNNFYKDNL